MKDHLRFVLILLAVLLALRFGFGLLVRIVQAVYSLVPLYVRAWYITIPLTLLIIYLVRDSSQRRKKQRKIDGLDPADEIHADVEIRDEEPQQDSEDDHTE